MTDPSSSIDVARERELYVEAVRRASALGGIGRAALRDAHELYAAAMIAANRPELAQDAVAALLVTSPRCPVTLRFAARVARLAGDTSHAAECESRAARLDADPQDGGSQPRSLKSPEHSSDRRSGVA